MIGDKGSYYRLEIAVSDPRQGETWWRPHGVYSYRSEADDELRRFKKAAIRVIHVSEECVTANAAGLVLMGERLKPKTKRRRAPRRPPAPTAPK